MEAAVSCASTSCRIRPAVRLHDDADSREAPNETEVSVIYIPVRMRYCPAQALKKVTALAEMRRSGSATESWLISVNLVYL